MIDVTTSSEELLALADQQAYARARFDDGDASLIRQSLVIEYALRLAARDRDWQSIASAPRDGTDVLLHADAWDMSWGVQIGHFSQGQWHTAEGAVADNDPDFDPDAEVFDEAAVDDDANVGPTRWMAIPEPPSSI